MSGSPVNCNASGCTEFATVMVLGDVNRAEMRQLVNWIVELVSKASRQVFVPDIASALRASTHDQFPDLVVVLQGWPDEYSSGEVNQLLAFAPLARVVVCYGAWCESDGRNHNIWPLSVRIPVWAARSRIEREWRLIQNPDEQLPLPWSASREEIFAADHPPILSSPDLPSFLVDSPDHAYRQSLIEIMITAGHKLVSDTPAILLFDADPWGQSRIAALDALREQFPHATVYALLNLALPSQVAALRDLGVTTVRHKLGFRFHS